LYVNRGGVIHERKEKSEGMRLKACRDKGTEFPVEGTEEFSGEESKVIKGFEG